MLDNTRTPLSPACDLLVPLILLPSWDADLVTRDAVVWGLFEPLSRC